MHREIMNVPPDKQVDHKDGDKLKNTKENLRLCTPRENNFNKPAQDGTSKFKGVRLKLDKWEAQIQFDGTIIYIGRFPTEEIAACAYNYYAKELFGEFARLNDVAEADWKLYLPKSSSKYKGISFVPKTNKWRAYIDVNKKRTVIGTFNSEIEAAKAYDNKVIELGLKRKMNFER